MWSWVLCGVIVLFTVSLLVARLRAAEGLNTAERCGLCLARAFFIFQLRSRIFLGRTRRKICPTCCSRGIMPDFILRSTGLGGRLSELAHGRRGLLHKALTTKPLAVAHIIQFLL